MATPRCATIEKPSSIDKAKDNTLANTPAAPLMAQNQALLRSPKRIIPSGKKNPMLKATGVNMAKLIPTLAAKLQPNVASNMGERLMLRSKIKIAGMKPQRCPPATPNRADRIEPNPAPNNIDPNAAVVAKLG